MKFEIDFNRETDDDLLLKLGAKWEHFDRGSFTIIDLNSLEELEELLFKVDFYKNDMYSAVVSFDPPTIFFDNDV